MGDTDLAKSIETAIQNIPVIETATAEDDNSSDSGDPIDPLAVMLQSSQDPLLVPTYKNLPELP